MIWNMIGIYFFLNFNLIRLFLINLIIMLVDESYNDGKKMSTNLPNDSISVFLHLPSTITRWCPPFEGLWKSSNAESVLFVRVDSIFRRSQALNKASLTWSSLWKTINARTDGFGGMRYGYFPSWSFYTKKVIEKKEDKLNFIDF